MCGIACILHTSKKLPPPSREVLERMAARLGHRGPDEAGLYRDAHLGMVHRRLSIIDISTGQQPMAPQDNDLWLTFNGEIFNYIELRETLRTLGHRFRTNSDTEVILASYRQWGSDCFARFNGQWALALWDTKARTLVLSRDRVGIRPLFVYESSDRVLAASEVKTIFADPDVPRSLDPLGLGQVMSLWSPMAPATVFAGIQQVPPGSTWTYSIGGKTTKERYWQPIFRDSDPTATLSPSQLRTKAGELKAALTEATKLRMVRSDVPVGSYLSGGIDSSVIAWMGREAYGGEYHTFSICFADAAFDEARYQRLMAKHLNSSHHELLVTRDDIARAFPAVISHTECPILRTAPAPMYLLSEAVRKAGFKAVLTGEGADEFLAGYDLFREAKIREFWSHQPASTARPRLFERIYPYLVPPGGSTSAIAFGFWKQALGDAGTPFFSHGPRWRTTMGVRKFLNADFVSRTLPPEQMVDFPDGFLSWDPIHRAQYLEITTLLSGYLLSSQGDRMLMAHSVEGRFPFLDAAVMEFCLSLPSSATLPGLDEKHILKDVARSFLPAEIVERKKQPYRAPDAAAFLGPSAPDYVKHSLSESMLRNAGVFDADRVSALVRKLDETTARSDDPRAISNSDNMAFIGILSTQLLHERILQPASADPTPSFTVCVDSADLSSTKHPQYS